MYENKDTHHISIAKDTARLIEKNKDKFINQTEDSAIDLIAKYDLQACWNKILSVLKRRDYACLELRRKLIGLGFSSTSVDECIDNAIKQKYINDSRFAHGYILSKKEHGWGKVRILRELKTKGVDLEILSDDTLEMLNEDNELKRAYSIVSRRSIPSNNPDQKLIHFLVGRGFTYVIAKQAVQQYLDDK